MRPQLTDDTLKLNPNSFSKYIKKKMSIQMILIKVIDLPSINV